MIKRLSSQEIFILVLALITFIFLCVVLMFDKQTLDVAGIEESANKYVKTVTDEHDYKKDNSHFELTTSNRSIHEIN